MQNYPQHPDFGKLQAIGRAVERKNKHLPSVRRDSPAWQAWRSWFRERSLETKWSDNQPGERLMTVVFEYPPADIDESYTHWVKSQGRKLNLAE